MSTWIQENIIKNLNAFQLLIVVLGIPLVLPLIDMFKMLLAGEMVLTLYVVLIFATYAGVLIIVVAGAVIVYRKDTEKKIETAKIVEFTPLEKFTLKQAISLIQGASGLKKDSEYVPAPAEEPATEMTAELHRLRGIIAILEERVRAAETPSAPPV